MLHSKNKYGRMDGGMKNQNELTVRIGLKLTECDALKEYLEDMALKGWKLKKNRELLLLLF
jgi:hypothetical protein